MISIEDKIVSLDVFKEEFNCHLEKCKGACCWKGDFGAPLEESELKTLKRIYPKIKDYFNLKAQKRIEQAGLYTYTDEIGKHTTELMEDGACIFMRKSTNGIAACGIEQAYNDGKTKFKKPISCHLYPIRVSSDPSGSFQFLNYDRWSICKAACSLGKELKMPLYKFLKSALIRKFGKRFYKEMEQVAQDLENSKV